MTGHSSRVLIPAPLRALPLGLVALALAGCANSPAPNHYQDLASAPYLAASTPGTGRRTPYRYEMAGALSRYRAIHLLPVRIYSGADQQFGTLTAAERAQLAATAEHEFRAALAGHGILAAGPAADAVELSITLTGAQASVPVLATASRLTPVGFAMSGLTAATDGEGRLSGMVIYAVEFREPGSGRILWAYVTKQYPNALDIGATLDPLDAARAGLKAGAQELARTTVARLRPQ